MAAENRRYCTFSLDSQLFGVAVERVQEVIRAQEMTKVPLAASSVSGATRTRASPLTAMDFRARPRRPVTAVS